MTMQFKGRRVTATQGVVPVRPEWAQTVGHWLIDAPKRSYHPVIDQWMLSAVRLDDLPGWPTPLRQFLGATHEILILAVHPDHPLVPEDLQRAKALHHLTPVNLAHQLAATDAEILLVLQFMARIIADETMPVEPPLGYESFRAHWAAGIADTLDHIRGGQALESTVDGGA